MATCRCRHADAWHDEGTGDCEMCDCARFVDENEPSFPPPPSMANRSRFDAVAEEMEDRVAPLKKKVAERPRVPRLFQETITIKTEPDGSVSVSACPRCGTGAFTPNAGTTEVICRGCPLPAPVFACDTSGVTQQRVIGNAYTCSRCGKRSSVTMTLAEVNLYCTGCGGLAIHTVEDLRPRSGNPNASSYSLAGVAKTLLGKIDERKAERRAKIYTVVSKDGEILFDAKTAEEAREFAKRYVGARIVAAWASDEEVTGRSAGFADAQSPTGVTRTTRSIEETDDELRARIRGAFVPQNLQTEIERGNILAQALASGVDPNDYAKVVEEITRRTAEIAGMSAEALFGTSPDVVAQTNMVELFRTSLGLENFMLFAARQRDKNMANDLKERDWDRRTGRTTKGMIEALAWVRVRNSRTLLVLGATDMQDRELIRLAADMKYKLGLPGTLAIGQMPRDWPNGVSDAQRDQTALYADHYFREVGRKGYVNSWGPWDGVSRPVES